MAPEPWSRDRIIFLSSIAFFAAGLGIYVGLNLPGNIASPPANLQRRNAVHRRHQRPREGRSARLEEVPGSSRGPEHNGGHGVSIPGVNQFTAPIDGDDSQTDTGIPAHGLQQNPTEGESLTQLVYHIAELQASKNHYIHKHTQCDSCNTNPIRGDRYVCNVCTSYDLCAECESLEPHTPGHTFTKIRVPAPFFKPPVQQGGIYPGRPDLISRSVLSREKAHNYAEQYDMITDEVFAYWDIFRHLANAEVPPGPNGSPDWGIDERAFKAAMFPDYDPSDEACGYAKDSFLSMRLFDFFASPKRGISGSADRKDRDQYVYFYPDFLQSMKDLHSRSPTSRLRATFHAADVDDDGFIIRRDLLRLMRAHFTFAQSSIAALHYSRERDAQLLRAREMLFPPNDQAGGGGPLATAFEADMQAGSRRPLHRKTDFDRLGNPRTTDRDTVRGAADRERSRALTMAMAGASLVDDGVVEDSERMKRAGDERVRERWERREFYADEEEGFTLPSSLEQSAEGSDDGIDLQAGFESIPKDIPEEVHQELMEYEMPTAEALFSKDLSWQLVTEGLNILLDPLFAAREEEDLRQKDDVEKDTQGRRDKHLYEAWKAYINGGKEDEKSYEVWKAEMYAKGKEAHEEWKAGMESKADGVPMEEHQDKSEGAVKEESQGASKHPRSDEEKQERDQATDPWEEAKREKAEAQDRSEPTIPSRPRGSISMEEFMTFMDSRENAKKLGFLEEWLNVVCY